jgi:hypothetical protein
MSGATTVTEFAEEVWLPAKKSRARPSSYSDLRTTWATKIKPRIGDANLMVEPVPALRHLLETGLLPHPEAVP